MCQGPCGLSRTVRRRPYICWLLPPRPGSKTAEGSYSHEQEVRPLRIHLSLSGRNPCLRSSRVGTNRIGPLSDNTCGFVNMRPLRRVTRGFYGVDSLRGRHRRIATRAEATSTVRWGSACHVPWEWKLAWRSDRRVLWTSVAQLELHCLGYKTR